VLIDRNNGSAPLESIFAMLVVLVLALGLMQVAFILYGRNVVISSAHEGARAAVELGRDSADAVGVAIRTVEDSAGGLVDDMSVDVMIHGTGENAVLTVHVTADLKSFGPLPVSVPVDTSASASLEEASL
jgi:TadE-like protein